HAQLVREDERLEPRHARVVTHEVAQLRDVVGEHPEPHPTGQRLEQRVGLGSFPDGTEERLAEGPQVRGAPAGAGETLMEAWQIEATGFELGHQVQVGRLDILDPPPDKFGKSTY